jgi:hypothetical protein
MMLQRLESRFAKVTAGQFRKVLMKSQFEKDAEQRIKVLTDEAAIRLGELARPVRGLSWGKYLIERLDKLPHGADRRAALDKEFAEEKPAPENFPTNKHGRMTGTEQPKTFVWNPRKDTEQRPIELPGQPRVRVAKQVYAEFCSERERIRVAVQSREIELANAKARVARLELAG